MSTADDSNMKCAACGKEGDGLKACRACKLVKYCDASCQKAHWSKHKKECKKRAAELHDEALFKEPPPRGECPICMLPLPTNPKEHKYQPCCGKMLCVGCILAAHAADNRRLCPFCRTPEHTSDEELVERMKKRAEGDDADAIHNLGCYYHQGDCGLPQDYDKAMEFWLQAGELGCTVAYRSVANAYYNGEGVERDEKKAKHYYVLAAMGGDVEARHNLGSFEGNAGNTDRAVKHWMIAAGAGDDDSLKEIRKGFMRGHATKDDFEKALRAHKEANDEMKSDQREAAAAYLRSRGVIE
jgi:TPR repeat protein